MKTIKPMKCWVNKEGENKSVSALDLKNFIADGWKVGKLFDKTEELDKIQETRETIIATRKGNEQLKEIEKNKEDVNKKEVKNNE